MSRHDNDVKKGELVPKATQASATQWLPLRRRGPFLAWLVEREVERETKLAEGGSKYAHALQALDRAKHTYSNLETTLKREDELAELDHRLAVKERLARLDALERQQEQMAPKSPKEEKNQYAKRLEAAQQAADFEEAMRLFRARKAIQTKRTLAKERDERIAEVVAKAKGRALTSEEEQLVEDIKDVYQKLIDEAGP